MAVFDSKPYGIIYCITNKANGKRYIGQTTMSLSRRWSAHCGSSMSCRALSNAIQKYGRENFNVEVIDSATCQEELDKKEQFYIACFGTLRQDAGYNLREGGNSSRPTEAARQKMAAAKKGRALSEDQKRKISEALRGRKKTDDHNRNVSLAKKGQQFSAEHRAKLSAARMGWVMPESHKIAVSNATKARHASRT